MGEIHEFLLQHLSYDGKGTVLDIGCGAGALTIRCAKHYPEAELVGMDYWGKKWNYAKEQCVANAETEGVADRCRFEKGDAAKLSYADESFDVAISNFVFHEVRTASDKRDVVREALRVIKPGGSFAFQDMFGQQKL
ncbi:MAG: class I SAM-dependent methyltransferase [Eubacteriales bacterium]|nr:class I SAM-dependent methyltransferase [Eubacteriales bacterium]